MINAERVDLHAHSNCSDGQLTAMDLLMRAADNEVAILSITDHDSVEAYTPELYSASRQLDLTLVPGIELSTADQDGAAIHILGLGIDPTNQALQESTQQQQSNRLAYARQVTERLHELGWSLNPASFEESHTVITKANIASSLLNDPANLKRLKAEFGPDMPSIGYFIETYLNRGKPAHIEASNKRLSPTKAVDIIHGAGGLAVYAHPVAQLYEVGLGMDELETKILTSGVDALEAIYIYFAKSRGDLRIDAIDEMIGLADRNDLMVSGGSDFHGEHGFGQHIDVGFKGEPRFPNVDVLKSLCRALSIA